jgi:hypothetical protein
MVFPLDLIVAPPHHHAHIPRERVRHHRLAHGNLLKITESVQRAQLHRALIGAGISTAYCHHEDTHEHDHYLPRSDVPQRTAPAMQGKHSGWRGVLRRLRDQREALRAGQRSSPDPAAGPPRGKCQGPAHSEPIVTSGQPLFDLAPLGSAGSTWWTPS